MGFLADPAVLGGIVTGAVLSGWLMGRQHAAPAAEGEAEIAAMQTDAEGEPPFAGHGEAVTDVTACQHAARAERLQVIEAARSLGELHAEVTAYRRQEQVLAEALSDGLLVELLPAAARDECRYLGLIGQPTCAVPGVSDMSCASRHGCSAAAAMSRETRAA